MPLLTLTVSRYLQAIDWKVSKAREEISTVFESTISGASVSANPIAVAACAADAVAATAGEPLDGMFWCAGSWGPFRG